MQKEVVSHFDGLYRVQTSAQRQSPVSWEELACDAWFIQRLSDFCAVLKGPAKCMCRAHSVNVQNLIIFCQFFFFFCLTDFFNVLIMLKLWFVSIPFLLSLIFLTLQDYCFVLWISLNNHCKRWSNFSKLFKCTQSTVVYKTDTRGHRRDSLNCINSQCISVSSGFKPTYVQPLWHLFCHLFLEHLTCKSCTLPSVHLQSVSSTLSAFCLCVNGKLWILLQGGK